MRGALENFATAAWLLDGPDRPERRCRTLRLWRQDMRNRAQHEEETAHTGHRRQNGCRAGSWVGDPYVQLHDHRLRLTLDRDQPCHTGERSWPTHWLHQRWFQAKGRQASVHESAGHSEILVKVRHLVTSCAVVK